MIALTFLSQYDGTIHALKKLRFRTNMLTEADLPTARSWCGESHATAIIGYDEVKCETCIEAITRAPGGVRI